MAKKSEKNGKDAEESVSIEIETTKGNLLSILDVVSSLVDEFALKFHKNGITISTVDPAHVAMIGMEVPDDYFEKYSYKSKQKEYRIGISITKVKEFLKTIGISDSVTILYDSKEKAFTLKAGRLKRTMAELDSTGFSQPNLPNLEMSTTITIKNDLLRTAIVAVEQISDHIKIETDGTSVKIFGEGDVDHVEMNLGMTDGIKVKGTKAMSMYPLDYFSTFTKNVSSGATLNIGYKDEYPCKIEFDVENSSKKTASATYFLAPRIESD